MMLRSLCLLAPFALLACTPDGTGNKDKTDPATDADADGLLDTEESSFGTDPALTDTDGDGLTDKQEFDLGTDGTSVDTDGDGYTDRDESVEGSDPTDGESLIYDGHWPYYAEKDGIDDPGFDGNGREGRTFGRFVGPDQFGQEVDVYDYAGQGKLTVIDLSGIWCYYCNEMAKWMEGRRSFLDDYADSYPFVDELPGMVADGRLQWVTILDSDANGQSIEVDEQAGWAEDYENDKIAVLGDVDVILATYLGVAGFPTVLVVDENMEIVSYNQQDYFEGLQYAYDNTPAE